MPLRVRSLIALAAAVALVALSLAPGASGESADPPDGITVVAIVPSDTGRGYLVVGDDGRVVAYGDATSRGSVATIGLRDPVVSAFGDDDGYALIAADGGVFSFGTMAFAGSMGDVALNEPIVGGAAAPGGGYRLLAADGGVFAFGGAPFHGSMGGIALNEPVVGGATSPGGGYWLVAADGGVFAFGGAPFHGSLGGVRLNRPIVDMAATPDGDGYWLFAADGGVFAFGTAGFLGSGAEIGATFSAFATTPDGDGYWAITPNGAVQTFGRAGRFGSPVEGPPRRDVTPTLQPIGRFAEAVAAVADPTTGLVLVAERRGRVLEWDPGTDRRRIVLDISSTTTTASERGLLGIALDADGGRLWLSSTDLGGDLVVSEVATRVGSDGRTAGSRRVLLVIDQPFANHNGGDIHFGPDGMVWIASGDGGSGGDPFDNSQDLTDLLGGILRIDPTPSPDGAPYSIPDDNPHAAGRRVTDCDGTAVVPRPELWAHGLRNPWRIAFDPPTGDLWIADVGQSRREEINHVPAAAGSGGGHNFGWNRREGTLAFAGGGACAAGSGPTLDPVFEYGHTPRRCSVTGGLVYRGDALPQLTGAYLFGDLCSGEVWALRPSDAGFEATVLAGVLAPGVVEFAEDADGEILVVSISDGVFRLSGI